MTKVPAQDVVNADSVRPTAARPPELLAPAGDWECARAAIENGADAIYFGLEKFNARMRANNFTEADLPRLVEFLHTRGARGYLGFNTLVFPDELEEAERLLRAVIVAGVDAVIVQDVGICRLIRLISPDFPIHASTQMTITSAAGVAFARELGCQRVILAREVPIAEIEKIRAAEAVAPAADGSGGVLLEVFVHGALCVAYSGQCLTSEALGGRSANRGICAQACRMPFELLADGKPVDLGDRRYLLSPQDLVGLEVLPALLRAGVAALKIEGRLKSPEYVANVTRVYREALDRISAEQQMPDGDPERVARELLAARRYELEMAFSRGLHTGWLRGIDNRQLVHGRFGKKRGVFLGEVTRVRLHEIQARLVAPLKPGDGVVFDAGRPDLEEEGGRVYEIAPANPRPADSRDPLRSPPAATEVVLRFGRGDVDSAKVRVGNRLWKTSDPELERKWRQSYAGNTPQFQRPVEFEVSGRVGEPLRLRACDTMGHTVELESAMPLVEAGKQPLTRDRLRDQLGRLGGTALRLGTLSNRLEGKVLLPVSELNRLRREAVAQLGHLRAQPARWTLTQPGTPPGAGHRIPTAASPPQREPPAAPNLIVLVRDLAQLDAALECQVATVYCDWADPRQYRTAVERFRTRRRPNSPTDAAALFVAPPRIHKTGEEWILDQVLASGADGFLARNPDDLARFAGRRCIGDFSLNVANVLAAEHFLDRYGLERVTASYDLNHAELAALLESVSPAAIEITVHQHMPMFHMEHCVFCAFLSEGRDYRDCGRPCDRHQVRLRDRVGIAHPVVADAACRNTVFNARPQTGAEHVATFLSLGARHFRLEFLDEPPDLVRRTIVRYRELLRGLLPGAQLWRELQLLNQLGVTRGPVG